MAGCGLHCLKVEHISVARGGHEILHDVNLHAHCGELTAVIGRNGAGKSTLFKAILGELILKDNWAEYAGKINTLGLVSGTDVEANYVQIPYESTQWSDTFTKDDYAALVAAMFDGTVTVSNDTETEPTVQTITVDYQGNIK